MSAPQTLKGVFLGAMLGDVLDVQDRVERLWREAEQIDAWTGRQLHGAYESLFNTRVRIERLMAGDTEPEDPS